MARHHELLEEGPREAPEPETAEQKSRAVRSVGVAATLTAAVAFVLFAAEFLPSVFHGWWVGLLLVVATIVSGLWESRDRISEWWENQP